MFDALAFWFALDEFEAVPARLLLDVLEAVAFVDAEAFALFDAVAFVDMFDAEVFEAFAELERLAFWLCEAELLDESDADLLAFELID